MDSVLLHDRGLKLQRTPPARVSTEFSAVFVFDEVRGAWRALTDWAGVRSDPAVLDPAVPPVSLLEQLQGVWWGRPAGDAFGFDLVAGYRSLRGETWGAALESPSRWSSRP